MNGYDVDELIRLFAPCLVHDVSRVFGPLPAEGIMNFTLTLGHKEREVSEDRLREAQLHLLEQNLSPSDREILDAVVSAFILKEQPSPTEMAAWEKARNSD